VKPTAVALSFALAVAACGGETSSASEPAPPSTGVADAASGSSGGTTRGTTGNVAAGAGAESPNSSTGAVSIGDTTYLFIVEDGGTCDPDFYGTFRAFLTLVDESGQPVEYEQNPGFKQGMVISVNAQGEGLMGGELDGVLWSAGNPDDGSTIDSVDIDGNRASGTATFVRPDSGEAVAGNFEVNCAGE
jgi:hypothetical protein